MNKPVAWIAIGNNTSVFFDLDTALSIDDNPTPLYTHPVNACKHGVDDGACKECYLEATQPAELTDDEIELIKKFQAERDKLKAEMPKIFADGKRLGIIETEDRFSKAMSMTNEEILSLWDWNSGEILATDLLDFADAILRKAQEK